MSIPKTLYILRHAKAEAGSVTQDDHDRELVERGVEAADQLGKYLVRRNIAPAQVLCSTAMRTRQTLEHLQAAHADISVVEYNPKIYLASGNELLQILAHVPEEINSVLLIGHNPGVHQLCLKLAIDGDEKLFDALHIKFPTCTFAAIEIGNIAWSAIANARGELVEFVAPSNMLGDD